MALASGVDCATDGSVAEVPRWLGIALFNRSGRLGFVAWGYRMGSVLTMDLLEAIRRRKTTNTPVRPEPISDEHKRLLGSYVTWLATQTEISVAFLEKAVADQAEANQISVDAAKARLVLEKLVDDRGPKFVEKFLREYDQSSKTLKPLSLTKKKR